MLDISDLDNERVEMKNWELALEIDFSENLETRNIDNWSPENYHCYQQSYGHDMIPYLVNASDHVYASKK